MILSNCRITSYNVCYTKLLRGKDGSVSPHLLVAAQEIGITEIFKAGSAWAVGALAYGTEIIPKVDVIVGPGNQYVAEAKSQVSGLVRIDMIAGPSEVLIVADESAEPGAIAADLLAQAEHDPLALAVLVTRITSYNVCYTKLLRVDEVITQQHDANYSQHLIKY